MGALKIKDVRKSFANVDILRGIDIEIDPGQFLILVGPSGCGKSTLLNCIAGLEQVTSGDIMIGDRVVNQVPPKDRDIAMVFQSYALYPNMNVRRNITFGMQMRGTPKAEQDETLARVAKMLQMEHLLDRRPSDLSGGQRQRVAMGRALARNPGLFLFDEPLSNLDAKLRVEMRTEIKLLHQRTRTTIVYVTHDQIEAMTLGDRIAVMKDGLVQQFGSPLEIYEDPANMFVAGFIGSPSMNFIPSRVVAIDSGGHGAEIRHGDHTWVFRLPTLAGLAGYVGREVILGIRPEALGAAAEGQPGYACEVDVVEPTGPDTQVFIHLNGKAVICRVAPRAAKEPGEMIKVAVDLDKVVLFDPTTQDRIR